MFPSEGISRFNLRKELLEDIENKKPLMIRAFYFCLPIKTTMLTIVYTLLRSVYS